MYALSQLSLVIWFNAISQEAWQWQGEDAIQKHALMGKFCNIVFLYVPENWPHYSKAILCMVLTFLPRLSADGTHYKAWEHTIMKYSPLPVKSSFYVESEMAKQ